MKTKEIRQQEILDNNCSTYFIFERYEQCISFESLCEAVVEDDDILKNLKKDSSLKDEVFFSANVVHNFRFALTTNCETRPLGLLPGEYGIDWFKEMQRIYNSIK